MDILKNIKNKIKTISGYINIEGLESVITHIERAEALLNLGQKTDEDDYFTDVIYRTNHAFEGILKEAYSILADRNASKKSPHEIEEFFNSENIFNERVLDLFINYRKNWRNPSTHDYKLFFSQVEAFLAIVSVSSFIHILLDQILEELSYKSYKVSKEEEIFRIKDALKINKNQDLLNQVEEYLLKFSDIGYKNEFSREIELVGALNAYLSSIDESLEIIRQYLISNNEGKTMIADFLIIKDNERLIIEIKNRYNKHIIRSGTEQLKLYLNASRINQGILFLNQPSKVPIKYESKTMSEIGGDYKIIIISPRNI